MADQFDRAQELDAYYRNQALAALTMKIAGKSRVTTGHCEDCGEEIPEGKWDIVLVRPGKVVQSSGWESRPGR